MYGGSGMKRPLPIDEKQGDVKRVIEAAKGDVRASMNVAIPGNIVEFFPGDQTATVQAAVRRRVRTDKGYEFMDYPLFHDVPVCFLGGGGHALTFPVAKGDECLVIFADANIDAWFQSGGVQDQISLRSHDLSDGFAIVGFRSQPKALVGMSAEKPHISGLLIGSDSLDVEQEVKHAKEWIDNNYTGFSTLQFSMDDRGYLSVYINVPDEGGA
jgi:hypothetical protein